MSHWLSRLLSPKSIAIVGASERRGSLAASTHQQLVETGFAGTIYSVNPKYNQLYGQACYPSLSQLPQTPDLVVYGISGLPLEASFDEALALGVGGIVIYASNYLENDEKPRLTERLKSKAKVAGIPVCGGNSMGFYNYDDNIFVSFDQPPSNRPAGHIGLILHSGSGMTYLANNDQRFCFNYVIASAQETNGTVADYIEYLLEQESTEVIAIMLEAVRDAASFVQALKKARERDIPVLVTKLARTEKSARLALSHSGAIVGDHDMFVAVCERYGVILCKDLDEMIITAMLFASGRRVIDGGIASILDSGGMREQMIDLADDYQVPFGDVGTQTINAMQHYLDAGLEADNPLDAMGALGRNTEETYLECGKALLDDVDTGLLTFEFEFRDGFSHYPELFNVIDQLSKYSHKPVIAINSCTYTNVNETAALLTQKGIPVINGIDVALRAIQNFMQYRPVLETIETAITSFETTLLEKWKTKLAQQGNLDEVTSLALMHDFGLPVVEHRVVDNQNDLMEAVSKINYPVVLKTAEPGIQHKSDQGGVIVDIQDEVSLLAAYRQLEEKLGRRAVIMPMLESGIEVSLGMKSDSQYGSMIIVATGGILIELIRDRTFALAPVSSSQAAQMLNSLKLSKLLDGIRGRPAVDRTALINLIVRFSQLMYAFGDAIQEVDLNPVIVTQDHCRIVDALIIGA